MKRYQSGVTLLEVLISIGVMSLLAVTLGSVANDSVRNIKEQNTAQYQKTVMSAAASWIKDNYSTVQATATPTAPHTLTVATLVAAKYLPAGFLNVNPFNQTTCILTLEPVANKLETVVVTEDGVEISQGRIPTIANLVGATGGFILPDGVTAQGSFGAWSRNIATFTAVNCSGTAASKNHLAGALFLDGNNLLNNYVSRSAVPGHPEANTMTTPLIISSVQAAGDACTTTGSITTAADGTVLTCQSGTYQPQGSAYWKDPVANFAALPACNAASTWQTRIVQTPTTGTGPRAYTCDAVSWKALAVDNTGNLSLPGTATVGKVQVNDVVTENTACASNGLVARDATGLLLSCQSSVWKKASGSGYQYGGVFSQDYCGSQGWSPNPFTGGYSCPTGYTYQTPPYVHAGSICVQFFFCYK